MSNRDGIVLNRDGTVLNDDSIEIGIVARSKRNVHTAAVASGCGHFRCEVVVARSPGRLRLSGQPNWCRPGRRGGNRHS